LSDLGAGLSDKQVYNWTVRHPFKFEDAADCVAVSVAPWNGLLSRWRFVLPAEYENLSAWGVAADDLSDFDAEPRGKLTSAGAVQMRNGPRVVWMGATQPLSRRRVAVLVFKPPAPHYIMFGRAPTPTAPPGKMEGISFNDHRAHPQAPEQS